MRKLHIIVAIIFASYFLISVKLAYTQFFAPLVQSSDVPGYVQLQKTRAMRGSVLDHEGAVLTSSTKYYDVVADPQMLKVDDKLLAELEKALNIPQATLEARIKAGSERYALLAQAVPASLEARLRSLNKTGLYLAETYKRHSAESSLAATLLGFVGKDDESKDIGYYGVEGYYERELRGLDGMTRTERDTFFRPIFFGLQDILEKQDGRTLTLTIDKVVQYKAKEKLLAGMSRYEAKEGCIIVADPHTMAIIALTCLPDYDPNEYSKYPEEYYHNLILSEAYEPGSTFKPLVVAAAIQEKAIKPTDTISETGPVQIGEYAIQTWDNTYAGDISITRVLEKSSNVGMVKIGEKLGHKKLYQWLQRFGLGVETGIDMQSEVPARLRAVKDWYPIDYATATFGQGIAVTPLQLLTAFSSLINGGELLQPYIVSSVTDGTDVKARPEKKVVRRVISPETSKIMRKMLLSTVEHAEYKWAKPLGYEFGGKTGTAQIAVGGKYHDTNTIASFIGFTPVDDPKFIALVILKEPKVSSWGSETAAPLFFELAEELLTYYNIAPKY